MAKLQTAYLLLQYWLNLNKPFHVQRSKCLKLLVVNRPYTCRETPWGSGWG